MKTYDTLIMGASYGSLLGIKLLLAGHNVKLVCLPDEAALFNKEGARVRIPVKGRDGLVEINSRKLPGKLSAGGPARRRSRRLRPDRAGDAGAAIPLARRARAAGRGGQVAQALHVDHEHAAAALSRAHSRPRHQQADALLHRCERVGQLRPQDDHAVQPGPAGLPPAGREGQRAAGQPADQLQGGALRLRRGYRDPASSSRPTSRRSASTPATAARSSCRSSSRCTSPSSCRWPSGACC